MSRFVLLLSMLLLWSSSQAQMSSDSLLSKIKTYQKNDSVRVELLIDACVAGLFVSDTQYIAYANEALLISKKINYKLGEIRALSCVGNYHFQRASYDLAIDFYTQALSLSEQRKDQDNIIISKSNVANVFRHTQKQGKAIALLKECDAILVNRGDSLSQHRAAILNNLASNYSSLMQHDSAVIVYKQALYICDKIKNVMGIALIKTNVAKEYHNTKDHATALNYAEAALQLVNEHKLDFIKTDLFKILGSIYLALGQHQKGVDYLNRCVSLSTAIKDLEALLEVYDLLHRDYAKIQDWPKAYSHLVQYMAVKDSVIGLAKEKAINEINTRYETAKKEASIKELQQANTIAQLQSQRKSIIIYSILSGIVLLSLLAYILFQRYKNRKQNELLKIQLIETQKTFQAEKKAAESELKALKSQMNPHFIFNALNSIQEQFMYGDKLLANEQLNNFTYLTRQILHVSGKKQINLSTEIDILTKYLDLEAMRFAKDFEYQILCAENIDQDFTSIPPMMIQPFVENSIKHGLLHKAGFKKLSITFELSPDETQLICTVEDNGIGRKQAAQKKNLHHSPHQSFSTESIEQRLQLLNENQPPQRLIIYDDLQDEQGQALGTRVRIHIPLGGA